MSSLADAFWWAFVTMTTVGYGDISPTTTLGRITAAILMVVGIGLISMLTGTIATFFLRNTKEKSFEIDNYSLNEEQLFQVEQFINYLKHIESKKDEL